MNLGYAAATFGVVLSFVIVFRNAGSLMLTVGLAAGIAGLAMLFAWMKSKSYKRFKLDFEEAVIIHKGKKIPFSAIVSGVGTSYGKSSSPKTITFSDGNVKLKAVIERASFKIKEAEAKVMVEFLNQTSIPYDSDTDLNDIEQKKFEGTKRNLNMLINSSFMK